MTNAELIAGISRMIVHGWPESEFCRFVGLTAAEVPNLAAAKVREGIRNHDPVLFNEALDLCHRFGFGDIDVLVLIPLLEAPWHRLHEQVVDAIVALRDPRSATALWHMAMTPLAYRTWDEFEGLEVKCVYGLWRLEAVDLLAKLIVSAGPRTKNIALMLMRKLAHGETAARASAVSALEALGRPLEGPEGEEDDDDEGTDREAV